MVGTVRGMSDLSAAIRLCDRLADTTRYGATHARVEVPLAAVAFACLTLGMGERQDSVYAALRAHPAPHLVVAAALRAVIPPGHSPALTGWVDRADERTVEALRDCLDLLDKVKVDLAGWSRDEDILGLVYGELPSKASRSGSGSYYTPLHLAKLVALLAHGLEGPPYGAKIMDPACGSGTMFIAVGQLLTEAGRCVSEVRYYGQDLDGIACCLTAVNVAYRGLVLSTGLTPAEREAMALVMGLEKKVAADPSAA